MAGKTKVKCSKCGCDFNTSQIKRHSEACDGSYKPFVKLTYCKYCDLDFSKLNSSERANHSRWCDKNPKHNEYLEKMKNSSEYGYIKMVAHNSNPEVRKEITEKVKKAHKEGKYLESYKKRIGLIGKKHTNETKINLSIIRKKFLSENPEKHPWKNNKKFISKPCEILKEKLRKNNINLLEEFNPEIEGRHFSCDIYLPNENLIIEVNGNQNYDEIGKLKPYYQERHDLLLNKGFKVCELHYSKVFKINTFEDLEY